MRDGEDLFEKYMPRSCVDLLKENDTWDLPYKFNHPSDLQMCDGEIPVNYNKLDLDVSAGSLVENIKLELLKDKDEDDYNRTSDNAPLDLEQEDLEQELEANSKGGKWMITRLEQGKLSNIHISQAIKILLLREYIARSRQKRHWAAKFLLGEEPLNPEHDVFVFGNVALKRIKKKVNTFLIARVQQIELIKDGEEVMSFKLKDNPPLRLRCALYTRVTCDDADDEYQVGDEIVLTPWRSPCGILDPVELFPIADPPTEKLPEPQHGKKSKKPGIDARGRNQGHNDTPMEKQPKLQHVKTPCKQDGKAIRNERDEKLLKNSSSKHKRQKALPKKRNEKKRANLTKGEGFRRSLSDSQGSKISASEALDKTPEHVVTLSSDEEYP